MIFSVLMRRAVSRRACREERQQSAHSKQPEINGGRGVPRGSYVIRGRFSPAGNSLPRDVIVLTLRARTRPHRGIIS